jgi:hypothetical protein
MSRGGVVLEGPWETPEGPRRRQEREVDRDEAQLPDEPTREIPKRQPGETGIAFVRRIAQEWHGLEVPPEDAPPPPPGKLRSPLKVTPYLERLEQIYRGVRDREPGEEG